MRERFPESDDPYFGTIAAMVFSGPQRSTGSGNNSSRRRSFWTGGGLDSAFHSMSDDLLQSKVDQLC